MGLDRGRASIKRDKRKSPFAAYRLDSSRKEVNGTLRSSRGVLSHYILTDGLKLSGNSKRHTRIAGTEESRAGRHNGDGLLGKSDTRGEDEK